jgi:hypothetical protein
MDWKLKLLITPVLLAGFVVCPAYAQDVSTSVVSTEPNYTVKVSGNRTSNYVLAAEGEAQPGMTDIERLAVSIQQQVVDPLINPGRGDIDASGKDDDDGRPEAEPQTDDREKPEHRDPKDFGWTPEPRPTTTPVVHGPLTKPANPWLGDARSTLAVEDALIIGGR